MNPLKSICVYCGSKPGHDPAFMAAAEILGKSLAENNLRLVYGGGTNGIMGQVSRAVRNNGGDVLGIIPKFLLDWEADPAKMHEVGEIIFTEDMHERKHAMFEQSDAFVALPGGIGTLEEIVEIMTWAQLGRHAKPMIFANVNGFWDPMLNLIHHMKDEGFLRELDRMTPTVVDDPADIIDTIRGMIAKNAGDGSGSEEIIEKM